MKSTLPLHASSTMSFEENRVKEMSRSSWSDESPKKVSNALHENSNSLSTSNGTVKKWLAEVQTHKNEIESVDFEYDEA